MDAITGSVCMARALLPPPEGQQPGRSRPHPTKGNSKRSPFANGSTVQVAEAHDPVSRGAPVYRGWAFTTSLVVVLVVAVVTLYVFISVATTPSEVITVLEVNTTVAASVTTSICRTVLEPPSGRGLELVRPPPIIVVVTVTQMVFAASMLVIVFSLVVVRVVGTVTVLDAPTVVDGACTVA